MPTISRDSVWALTWGLPSLGWVMHHSTEAALDEIEVLERNGRLAGYHYLPAVRADLLRRLGRHPESATAYRAALDLADNEAERDFLAARLAEAVDSGPGRLEG
jgi:RNA polymerase sigma-70 factor, ECF subfamily